MPSTTASRVRDWLTAQQQVATLAAIVLALPVAYGFERSFGEFGGSFLLLVTLGVGVPMAYEGYWFRYDRTWKVVAWVLVACVVATVAFVGLYLVGTELLVLDPFLASAGAFLVTDLGGLALLSAWRRT